MKTYRIERVDGQFEVAAYERKWLREKRTMIHRVERLSHAEECFIGVVAEDFARELDRRRFATVTGTIADCEPRVDEEHIYTAIVLAGGRPPNPNEIIGDMIHEVAERMTGGKFTRIEKRMFLHRFITWYAKENPLFEDPRLVQIEEFARAHNSWAAPVQPPTLSQRALNQLRAYIRGKKP